MTPYSKTLIFPPELMRDSTELQYARTRGECFGYKNCDHFGDVPGFTKLSQEALLSVAEEWINIGIKVGIGLLYTYIQMIQEAGPDLKRPINLTNIARRNNKKPSTVFRQVKRLIELDFLVKVVDGKNGMNAYRFLTSSSMIAAENARRAYRRHQQKIRGLKRGMYSRVSGPCKLMF